MTGLPKGWTTAPLGDVVVNRDNQRVPVNAKERSARQGVVPYYGAAGQVGWIDRALFDEELLLLGEDGVQFFDPAKTKAYLIDGPSWVNNHAHVLSRANGGPLLSYLKHFLDQFDYRGYANGTTRLKLTRSAMDTIPVALAPLGEQERIVTAIEEAFSKLDAGEAGLRTVRQLLKRMREAVLAAAVTGRLVRQDPSGTSAAKLLADLGVEPLDDPRLPLLPSCWSWAQVQDVGQVDLGRQRSPKYHSGDNMKPYLRVANVFEDRIDTSDVMEMHFEPEAFERSRLAVGDILLNEGQTPELLGRPAMYRGDPPEVAFTNSLLRFRASTGIDPEWALLVFRHHMHSGRFTRESRITTNIAHLSAARFKPVEFPVPPALEQRRIVEEFAKQSSFIDACERAVDAGLARSTALRRSVLKAAFEGRLVPQDPSDEPASLLLERIRDQRTACAGSGGGRRRKKVEAP